LLFFSQAFEGMDMFEVYFPIFVLIFIVAGMALLILAFSYLFGRRDNERESF